jgi:hypothetical protein
VKGEGLRAKGLGIRVKGQEIKETRFKVKGLGSTDLGLWV